MVNILIDEVYCVKSGQERNVLKTLTDACVKGYTYDCNDPVLGKTTLVNGHQSNNV